MNRQARIDLPNYWYHLIFRGVNKENIFISDEDKYFFLSILNKLVIEYSIKLSSFSLMDNHGHLMLFRETLSLYKFMHRLLTTYSIYFNKKYERVGHLLQDRFKSIIVLDERHILNLLKYIHLNAVKAHIVENPDDYPFSSHGFYCGEKSPVTLYKLPYFNTKNGVTLYKNFMSIDTLEKDIDFETGSFIGNEEEYKNLEKRVPKHREKSKIKENRNKIPIEKLTLKIISNEALKGIKSSHRTKDIIELRRSLVVQLYNNGYTISEIARFLDKSKPAIFYVIKNYENR